MSRRAASILVAATFVLAAGCSRGADDSASGDAVGSTTTTTTITSTTTPRVDDAAGTTTGITVTLVANRLVVGGNALVFGAPEFQVRSYLQRALLDPTKEDEQDCAPGHLTSVRWPAVTAYLDDGKNLAGWYVDTPALATDKGVRVGDTRAEVEAAYPNAQITETSLGTELWSPLDGQGDVAGLSGVFDAAGKVTALWSGATCVAR
jgi:hypothetical protein